MQRRIAWILVALAFVALFGWRFRQRRSQGPQGRSGRGPSLVTVVTAAITNATILDQGMLYGTIAAQSEFAVSPKIGGRVKRLSVDLGDRVTNGQAVACLDDEELVHDVEQARAALQVAKASAEETESTLNLARQEFQRVTDLKDKQIVSDSEYDGAKGNLDVQGARQKLAAAQVAQREAALRAATVRRSYATVTAAWESGNPVRLVGKRSAEEGALVRMGDPLILLVDLQPVIAAFEVTEREYARIRPGQSVHLTSLGVSDRAFEGKVVRVAPRFEETTRQARVEVEIPNEELLLKPGMFAQGRIDFARHDQATVAPLSALARRNGVPGVFLLQPEGPTVRFVPITPGITSSNAVEIVTPPIRGDVVTLGHHLLEDGSAVALPRPGGGPRRPPRGPGGPPGKGRP